MAASLRGVAGEGGVRSGTGLRCQRPHLEPGDVRKRQVDDGLSHMVLHMASPALYPPSSLAQQPRHCSQTNAAALGGVCICHNAIAARRKASPCKRETHSE